MKVLLRFSALAFLVVCLVLLFGLRNRVSAQGITISTTQSFCNGTGNTTPCVWTYHNDNNRDGVNPNEATFTPSFNFANLTATTVSTDGLIYGQPLYIHSLHDSNGNVGSCTGTTNVVFVATENDTVYAFNASGTNIGQRCWIRLLDRSTGQTAITWHDLPTDSNGNPATDLVPEVGTTSTPVIDLNVTPPIMYVLTAHKQVIGQSAITYDHVLHAIDTTTGNEIVTGQSVSSALGTNFVPLAQKQRASLALSYSGGVATVFVIWAGFNDSNSAGNYNGWVAQFQLQYSPLGSLTYVGSFTSEPAGAADKGGTWMGGAAPAIDSSGNIYVGVGNGTLHLSDGFNTARRDNSVVKIAPGILSSSTSPSKADYYTPNVFKALNFGASNLCVSSDCSQKIQTLPGDMDMGTGGVVLLSPTPAYPELVSTGKEGMFYTLFYSPTANGQMGGLDGCSSGGGYCSTGGTGSVYSTTDCTTNSSPIAGDIAQCYYAIPYISGNGNDTGLRGAPVYWGWSTTNGYMYMAGIGLDPNNSLPLQGFEFNGTTFKTSTIYTPDTKQTFPYPGGMGSLTWNGSNTSTGIVWVLDTHQFGKIICGGTACSNPTYHAAGPAVLYAYAASPPDYNNVLKYLWDSHTGGSGGISLDQSMPGAVKFVMPTVAEGSIFIAGGSGYPNFYFDTNTGNPCPSGTGLVCAGELTILH